MNRVKGTVRAGAELYKKSLWHDYVRVRFDGSIEFMQLRGLFIMDYEIDGRIHQKKVVLGRWLERLPGRDRTTMQRLAWEKPPGASLGCTLSRRYVSGCAGSRKQPYFCMLFETWF